MSDNITVVDNSAAHRFEVELEGKTAFAEYRVEDERMTLPHTLVPPEFEGRGVASALARHAFNHAREKGLTVIPSCPFMAAWVKKHPEFQGLVDPGGRAELGHA